MILKRVAADRLKHSAIRKVDRRQGRIIGLGSESVRTDRLYGSRNRDFRNDGGMFSVRNDGNYHEIPGG